jgi:hypothetical protein
VEQRRRDVIPIVDAILHGVGRCHAVAAVVEDATGEQGISLGVGLDPLDALGR